MAVKGQRVGPAQMPVVSCLPPDAGSVHHALVSAPAYAASSQGRRAAAKAWAAGAEGPEVSLPSCSSRFQSEWVSIVRPGLCCPARYGAAGEPLCSWRSHSGVTEAGPVPAKGFSPQSRPPQSPLACRCGCRAPSTVCRRSERVLATRRWVLAGQG